MTGPYLNHATIPSVHGSITPRTRASVQTTAGEDARLANVIEGARAVLRGAIALMGKPASLPDGVPALFRLVFLADIDRDAFAKVQARLEVVCSCLHNAVTVKVVDLGKNVGYANFYATPETKKRTGDGGSVKQRTQGMRSGQIVFRGDIHIDRSLLTDANLDQAVITLIHEASHKYASTEDHGRAGYFREDYSGYYATGLTPEQARNNADSHAFFAFLLVELASGRVTIG